MHNQVSIVSAKRKHKWNTNKYLIEFPIPQPPIKDKEVGTEAQRKDRHIECKYLYVRSKPSHSNDCVWGQWTKHFS